MKWTHGGSLVAGLAAGLILSSLLRTPAVAQPPTAATVGRFQIDSFAAQRVNGDVFYGCYVVDTATGQLWQANGSSQAGSQGKVWDAPAR